MSYKSQFSKSSENSNNIQKILRESAPSFLSDVENNTYDEGNITKEDSEYFRNFFAQSSQNQKPSSNRISDVDENVSFMTGRRDTADMQLLMGIQELLFDNQNKEDSCFCLFVLIQFFIFEKNISFWSESDVDVSCSSF